MLEKNKFACLYFISLSLLLVLGCSIYWQGLYGPFLLDDFVHLPNLGKSGNVDSWSELLKLIFSKPHSTGRPLGFMSLLINDNGWPTIPFAFKYTNLMLHLLNGILVLVLFRLLVSASREYLKMGERYKAIEWIALFGAAVWLLHPLQLSSVMLVIQRFTLLMGAVSLLGLILYGYARFNKSWNDFPRLIVMSLGIGGMGVVGALVKESILSIVFYVLVIEIFLGKGLPKFKSELLLRIWLFCFCITPIVLFIAYYFFKIDYMTELWGRRDFSMSERLMTESRILFDYLHKIIIPSMSTGPYHDDYLVSRGLFSPVSTIFSIVGLCAILFLSFFLKNRVPLLGFACVWFLGGHFIESTFLPLELYFEHRNYLPMLGFAFSFSVFVMSHKGKLAKYLKVFAGLYLSLSIVLTFHASKVWGVEGVMVQVWGQEHPKSVRAQFHLLNYWASKNDKENVERTIDNLLQHNGSRLGVNLHVYSIQKCKFNDVISALSEEDLHFALSNYKLDFGAIEVFKNLFDLIGHGRCDAISKREYVDLIVQLDKSGMIIGEQVAVAAVYDLLARGYIRIGDLDGTITSFDKAYDAYSRYDIALLQAYYLATAGLFEDAESYIEKAKNTPKFNKYAGLFMSQDIKNMEATIEVLKLHHNGSR